MLRFIAIRLIQAPLIVAIIYVLTFLLAWVAPGSPFDRAERNLPPEVMARIKTDMHAENWHSFLAHYPWQIVRHGDFGASLAYEQWSVNDILNSALPVSVALGLFAVLMAVVVGVSAGTLAAARQGGPLDLISLVLALVGISVPGFVVAAGLLVVFCVHLHWFPIGTWGRFRDLILPGTALSLVPMAYIARLIRVAMIDVLSSDYVRTARAKGLSRFTVIWKHCLRNACLPVLSYLGPASAATLTGSFVVEKVFNLPGLGQHFINSILNRDQTLILGTVMVYSLFLLGFNLLVDIAYALVDPRIDVTGRQTTTAA